MPDYQLEPMSLTNFCLTKLLNSEMNSCVLLKLVRVLYISKEKYLGIVMLKLCYGIYS